MNLSFFAKMKEKKCFDTFKFKSFVTFALPFLTRIRSLKENKKAEVAQLVEQLICNQLVGGSSPFFGSFL